MMKDTNYEDGYKEGFAYGYLRGLEENKKNNKKLRNLQMAILSDAENRKEEVIAVNQKTFEEIKGKEITLRLTAEILELMEKEIEQ